MSRFVAARIEKNRIMDAWGPFPTAEGAADWLGSYDARLLDYLWDRQGDEWFADLEVGDMEIDRFQIRPLHEPAE